MTYALVVKIAKDCFRKEKKQITIIHWFLVRNQSGKNSGEISRREEPRSGSPGSDVGRKILFGEFLPFILKICLTFMAYLSIFKQNLLS